MALNVDIDWDQLSVGSSDSFFERKHPEHEIPLQKILIKSQLEKWAKDVENCMAVKAPQPKVPAQKPVATVRPSSGQQKTSAAMGHTKKTSTIPVTPNVLRKRITTVPRTAVAPKPDPYVFKAKPAPAIHKSCNDLRGKTATVPASACAPRPKPRPPVSISVSAPVPASACAPRPLNPLKALARDMNKLTVASARAPARVTANKENSRPTNTTTTHDIRSSRAPVRATQTAAHPPRPRSTSGKSKTTVPVTPMVLKRHRSRTRTRSNDDHENTAAAGTQFKAKPAGVLQRKPFVPKLGTNTGPNTATGVTTKPFLLSLDGRLKDRQTFNHRSTEVLDKKQKDKLVEKKRVEDAQYAEARRKTVFKANPNPFK